MKTEAGARLRHAVSFDKELYSYIAGVARERGESFSAVCASMLREIMRDDLATETPAIPN
jgi:negative regulator of replication initiation